MKINFFLGKR